MQHDTILVYTENTLLDSIERGGVCWWRSNYRQALGVKYAIGTKRGGFDDGAAKYVVKVSEVVKHHNYEEEKRVSYAFVEYAEVDIPGMWPHQRNPFTYVDSEKMGIDFDKLEWRRVGEAALRNDSGTLLSLFDKLEALTLGDIKKVIAKKFDVDPSAVEINVKA
jgi:hypothetical protein